MPPTALYKCLAAGPGRDLFGTASTTVPNSPIINFANGSCNCAACSGKSRADDAEEWMLSWQGRHGSPAPVYLLTFASSAAAKSRCGIGSTSCAGMKAATAGGQPKLDTGVVIVGRPQPKPSQWIKLVQGNAAPTQPRSPR